MTEFTVPQGWKLVPVEPTRGMLDAAHKDLVRDAEIDVMLKGIHSAMLAAAPQPPTTEDCSVVEPPQVEQEPVAWRLFDGDPFPGTATRHVYYDKDDFKEGVNPTEHFQLEPLYTHPQNLRCKSTQARLATLWGYEKPQPPRKPLTAEQIGEIEGWFSNEFGLEAKHSIDFARAIERAHGIGGEE